MMIRIAVYCRVSTDHEDQVHSMENQRQFFLRYISAQPEWELYRVYADEGITGTSVRKRQAFRQMMEDALAHRFDLVLTKEISRFARNTLDSIYYTRKLKELGVGVLFLNDNINTLDPDAELRLTILSSIAQEESRKTSERVKWGQKRRMERGVVFGRGLLGYDVRDGHLFLNPDGAETVRSIFHKFLEEGKGCHTIARELELEGFQTATGMRQWSNASVLRVLRNEKYCGDLVQKKTVTLNYLTHEKKWNDGEEDFVILRNHHEPIIARDRFIQAQKELARRAQTDSDRKKYSNRYCFSGKLRCAVCGNMYIARTRKRVNGTSQFWRCHETARHGVLKTNESGETTGCNNLTLRQAELAQAMMALIQTLPLHSEKITKELCGMLRHLNGEGKEPDFHKRRAALALKQQRLLDLYLDGRVAKSEFAARQDALTLEDAELCTQIEKPVEQTKKAIPEQASVLIQQVLHGEQFDETFYRTLIESIEVAPSQLSVKLAGSETRFQLELVSSAS